MSLLSSLRQDISDSNQRDSIRNEREEILRDLQWLFNATTAFSIPDTQSTAISKMVLSSVLNYGLPPFAGATRHKFHSGYIQEQIRLAIERFEPRLLPDTIVVSATNANKDQAVGILSFEIKALMQTSVGLDALEILSRIDLDTGEVVLMEV